MTWWRHVVAMEFRKILAYRSDFWVTFLGQTLIQLLVAKALWQMIFSSQGVEEMQGYSLEMMGLYYLIIPIGNRMLTGENMGFISREIYDGTFTKYLLYPLSVFQYKTLTYLTYSLFYGFQLVLISLLYRWFFGQVPVTGIDVIHLSAGLLLFLLASWVYAMMAMLIELIALWADNIWSLMVMLRFFSSFFGGAFIPLAFLPNWTQELLKWTPFPYLISLPTRTVMGLTNVSEIVGGVLILITWIIVFRFFVSLVWKRGDLHYTGVGI
jgi:ABC-2 type transport system permease protein